LLAITISLGVSANAQTVTTVFNFSGSSVDPVGVLAQGRDGNFYGVTVAPSIGTIYKVSASGTFTLLHSLLSTEGQSCNGLILGTDGNFYGTCFYGGDNGNSTGSFIKVTPAGTLTVPHYFDGTFSGTTDGCYPRGMPVQASDGNFYGTTQLCGLNDQGIAYKISPAGVFTVIHAFTGTDGGQPEGTLIQGSDGNLWGTTYAGGPTGSGTIFKMTLSGTVTSVYQFNGCGVQGCNPVAGLVQGNDGNFYGVAQSGGANNEGAAFKVTPSGTQTVLHNFSVAADNGAYPQLPLTLGTDGNFYGIASDCFGGGCSSADIFEVTPRGVFTDVYNFTNFGGNNNSLPFSPLLLATTGKFYSTTEQAGATQSGTFYSLTDGQHSFVNLLMKSGKVGANVQILGQGFSGSSVVEFDGVAATGVTRNGSTFLQATVPAGALTGSVTVTTGATTLTSFSTFKVIPQVLSFTPPSGPVGTVVTITGVSLTQATAVKFNGVTASFTVNSDTQISATVPSGATTGAITVTTPGGMAKSATNFTVN
jgi:uncharacterized repeat protein (TIGR03803 family)